MVLSIKAEVISNNINESKMTKLLLVLFALAVVATVVSGCTSSGECGPGCNCIDGICVCARSAAGMGECNTDGDCGSECHCIGGICVC